MPLPNKVHLAGADGLWNVGAGADDTFPDAGLNFDWWMVHTTDAIYVAANVVDDIVLTDTAEAGSEDGNTWEDDSVEIFFDGDTSKNLNGPNFDFEGQYVLSANGAHRDNEARNPTFGPSDQWFAASSLVATGYQIEFKILKANLQNPTNGTSMGFMIAVNDDDGDRGPGRAPDPVRLVRRGAQRVELRKIDPRWPPAGRRAFANRRDQARVGGREYHPAVGRRRSAV